MNRIFNTKIARFFIRRLPDSQSIVGVYAVIVFLIYSWTLLISFYKFPSWLLEKTIPQILSIYAYAFLANFVESIFVLAGILLLDFSLFLILKNKEDFQVRSIVVTLVLLISSMWRLVLFRNYEDVSVFVSGEAIWWIITVTIGLPLAVFSPKIKLLKSFFEGIAERAIVFLYIYPPISFFSLIIVIVRNIY